MKRKRRIYDAEYKRMAVDLVLQSEKTGTEVAQDLGIRPTLVNRWVREYEIHSTRSFPGNGVPRLSDEQKQIAELKKQLADARLERDILKKAVSIFSVSDRKSSNS